MAWLLAGVMHDDSRCHRLLLRLAQISSSLALLHARLRLSCPKILQLGLHPSLTISKHLLVLLLVSALHCIR